MTAITTEENIKKGPDSTTLSNAKAAEKPKGEKQVRQWSGQTLEVTADWIVLRKKDQPVAEMFFTSYRLAVLPENGPRPLTFVFNGGPGAASAFLHLGGLGPDRVFFQSDGNIAPPPVHLVNNTESWLPFTDLVFIDPVGTGLSQIVAADGKSDEKKDPARQTEEKEFFQLNRDLDSLCEFIERFLSQNRAWDCPIYLAGESYGGYRSAKLARRLQDKSGVALSGVMMISPALEWGMLIDGDYEVLRCVDNFCSMALAAAFHGRSRVFPKGTPVEVMRPVIEKFATQEYAHSLLVGSLAAKATTDGTLSQAADFLGLSSEVLQLAAGRIPFWRFCRDLLKAERKVLGFYDATITAWDPFPDRELHQAPDPTLVGDHRVFTTGINLLLRNQLGLTTDRRYELLSEEVNTVWKRDDQKHVFDTNVGATDDLRFAMSMNPHMKVMLVHGYYDLVTPYFTSERLVAQMKLPPELTANLEVKYFGGGHMFYTWDKSRQEFRDWAQRHYQVPPRR